MAPARLPLFIRYFTSGSYKIEWGGDPSKCVDAGDMAAGQNITLWDCNGATSVVSNRRSGAPVLGTTWNRPAPGSLTAIMRVWWARGWEWGGRGRVTPTEVGG